MYYTKQNIKLLLNLPFLLEPGSKRVMFCFLALRFRLPTKHSEGGFPAGVMRGGCFCSVVGSGTATIYKNSMLTIIKETLQLHKSSWVIICQFLYSYILIYYNFQNVYKNGL